MKNWKIRSNVKMSRWSNENNGHDFIENRTVDFMHKKRGWQSREVLRYNTELQQWSVRIEPCIHKAQKCTVLRVKVKVTLVQALRLCTDRTAHRGSRGIARYSSTVSWPTALEGGKGSASRLGRSLPPGKKTRYSLYIVHWVGLDRCGKSCLHLDSIAGPSSP